MNYFGKSTGVEKTDNAFAITREAQASPLESSSLESCVLSWDSENRLVEVQVTGGGTVNFIYDAQSRRIGETVGATTKITLYDGWNPIAEVSGAVHTSGTAPEPTLEKTWLWGTDLSGTLQGAGGVGGLLAVNLKTGANAGVYHPLFDGNGNIGQYINSSGTAVAKYEYDGFGNTLVSAGSQEADFPHRFSTKPLDTESGLYYYGYRYFDPVTGRWPNRDPIWERGGVNLYGFVGNDGIGNWDLLGHRAIKNPGKGSAYIFIVNGLDWLSILEDLTDQEPREGEVCVQVGHSNSLWSGQCATCCQLLTCTRKNGVTYDAASTTTWVQGDAVGNETPNGVMIATGWVNGEYPNQPSGNHTAIYLGPGSTPGHIKILSQNDGRGAHGANVGVNEWPISGWHIVTSNMQHESKRTKCTIKKCTPSGELIEEISWEEAVAQWNRETQLK